MAGEIVFGLDVARGGEDKNVVAIRSGYACLELSEWQTPDLMDTAGRVVHMAKRHHPEAILVDVNGLGAGVYDRLRELGLPVVPFLAQEGTDETDSSGELQFINKRSHAWWMLRERLAPYNGYRVVLPLDQELQEELAAPSYKVLEGSGRIKVDGKEDLRKKLKRSPNKADAVVMAFYEGSSSTYEESFRSYTPSFLREEERRREREEQQVADEVLILNQMLEAADKRRGKLPWDL